MVLSPMARMILLGFLAVLLLFGLFTEPRYGVDHSDLVFADDRSLWGIAGFANSMSALLISVASLFGLWTIHRKTEEGFVWEVGARFSWSVFFIGAALGAISSLFLHIHPSLITLAITRLFTLISVMGLWNALMIERVDPQIGLRLAPWFYLFACFSIGYWIWSEAQGLGDLRFYTAALVYPMMLLPMILSLFPLEAGGGGWLILAWLVYLGAKICEVLDETILTGSGQFVSGHTVANIGLALAVGFCGVSLLKRRLD
jgi:hypothetical protein